MTLPTDTPVPETVPLPDDAASGDDHAEQSTLGQTRHEPTVRPWELELLISGAVVFALIQLPGAVDDWQARLLPRMADTSRGVLLFLYIYVKLILYTLIASFLLHLCVRAYWVGIIGLESVFPRGINWENTQFGPVGRTVQRRRVPSLQQLIDRSDKFASIIFGMGFTVVLIFAFTVVYAGVYLVASDAIARAFFGGGHGTTVMLAMLALTLLPLLVISLIDRRWGERMRPGGRGWRAVGAVYAVAHYLQGMWLFGPTMLTLFSNFNRKKAIPVFMVLVYSLLAFALVKDVLVARGRLSADSYAYFPENPGRLGVGSGYYEDRRAPGEVSTSPSIQSDVIREPYVRLFLPYLPNWHNALFARACPEVRPFTEPGLRLDGAEVDPEQPDAARAVLRCWARVQPVTLNGRPLDTPFRFYTHPMTGVRGIVAHVPTAALPRGENLITIGRLPPSDEARGEAPLRERPPIYIPFWL